MNDVIIWYLHKKNMWPYRIFGRNAQVLIDMAESREEGHNQRNHFSEV